MKRLGVFLDVGNLYYCIRKKYDKRKLDYRKYLQYLEDIGEIVRATAYGTQKGEEATGFIHCLKHLGLETKFKTAKDFHDNWHVDMSIDMVRMLDRVDTIILGTANPALAPSVEHAVQAGVSVIVFACGINKDLKKAATEYIEIPESLLEG